MDKIKQTLLSLAGALSGGVTGVACALAAIRLYKLVIDFPPGADRRAPLLLTIGAIVLFSAASGCVLGVMCAVRLGKRWK